MNSEFQAKNHIYDGWIYRKFIDPSLAGIRKRVARLVPEGSKVLDVGCGTGDQLLLLASKIQHGVGVELSESMINTCRHQVDQQKITNCEFILADATNLSEFQDHSFDYAMSSMVIHEMPAEKRMPVLQEIKRVGKLVILVDWIYPQPSFWKKTATHIVERLAGREHYSGFQSFMEGEGMPALLEAVGLEVIETQVTSKGTIQLWLCAGVG